VVEVSGAVVVVVAAVVGGEVLDVVAGTDESVAAVVAPFVSDSVSVLPHAATTSMMAAPRATVRPVRRDVLIFCSLLLRVGNLPQTLDTVEALQSVVELVHAG
jgi:ABC-type antimicrobial peptide transport system permease subunit